MFCYYLSVIPAFAGMTLRKKQLYRK